ncbi:MAG: 4-(cytidine 5'-diphospho)-2-C-methyl-D-erythritol kinase, partial [Rhodothermales bacterium]
VLRKRSDGFHDVETVFIRVPWADILRAETATTLRYSCSDPALPSGETNLVVRAARLLGDALGIEPRASIHLDKHLPTGAGLGGGSSDAATTLVLLNKLWRADATDLVSIGARLGSDVPFFLGPEAAYGTRRGEMLEMLMDPETREPYRPPFPLVIAVPAVSVSTALAYSLVTPKPERRPDLREIVLSNDLERWRRELANDFEGPVFEQFPAIAAVRNALSDSGADYVSMSGSGSAVYAFFEDDTTATAAAEAMRWSGHRVWHGRV